MTSSELIAHQIEIYRGNNKVVDLEEFREDYSRISSIIKAITTYNRTGDLKTRLIINHIIISTNVFGPFQISLMFLKCDPSQHEDLFTFVNFLGFIPDDGHLVLPDYKVITTKQWKVNPYIASKIEEELCRY